MDRQAFKQAFFDGKVFDAYRWFGAHLEGDTAVFRTFAPNAARITVTGACNGWNETDLTQDGRSGFWEGRCTGAAAGQFYKSGTARSPNTATPTAARWNCGRAAARSSPPRRVMRFRTRTGCRRARLRPTRR